MLTKETIKTLGFNSIQDLDPKAINLIKWDVIAESVAMIIFAFTSPVIIITMMSSVDPIWYQISRLIEYGLGGLINLWFNKNKLTILRKYFIHLCILDCVLTIYCNIIFAHLPNYRFIAISLLNVLMSGMIFRIIGDIMNNITNGSDLSILNSRKEGFEQISILLGTISIMIITYYNIDFSCDMALTLQCVALIISCLTSLFITRKLMKYAKYED